jgi:glycosyltransferase involved in cell wall biosynthesis
MKIYFDDIAFCLQKAGGISVYIAELTGRMLADRLDVDFIEHDKAKTNLFRAALPVPSDSVIKEANLPVLLTKYLPVKIPGTSGNNSLFHSSYYRLCGNTDVCNVVTVYDFIYEYYVSGPTRFIHNKQKMHAVANADGVICISESTRADLLKFCPTLNPKKVTVINLAASSDFCQLDPDEKNAELKLSVPELADRDYILYVGARVQYKNFQAAIATVKKLVGYTLVIAGGKPLSKSETEMLDKELPGRYLHLGKVDGKLLNLLYNCAFCLLYPSSYEGFGIPLVEAMQSGCPVVTTDRSSIPEVCGKAGLMATDTSPETLSGLIRLLENDFYRERKIRLGLEQAKKFSWDKTYSETIEFYRLVLNGYRKRPVVS